MGMFNNIKCEYPLPDGFDASKLEFQTKSLPVIDDLSEWTITREGELVCTRDGCYNMNKVGDRITDFHGDLYFGGSNWASSGPEGFTTRNDDEPLEREYVARFTNGKLQEICLVSDVFQSGGRPHIRRKAAQ